MYDTAKRSMAFTIATGGLLLAGPACAAAAAAQDAGAPAGSLSAHADAGEPLAAQALGARFATPNGGIGSGNTLDVPIDLGLNLCGNTISVLARTSASPNCSITSGSAATGSAALAAPAGQRGGLLSNNAVRAPINLLLNACGNGAAVAAVSSTSGSACAIDQPAVRPSGVSLSGAALGMPSRSGVLSANSANLPISVPVNACGNALDVLSNSVSQTISCAIDEGMTGQQGSGQSAAGAGSASSAISTGSTTSTTTTTTTTTVTSSQSQTSSTHQAQAIAVPPALSTAPIRVGGIGTGIADANTAAQHAVAAPAAMVMRAAKPRTDQLTVMAQPRVIWPRPEAAALALAPREANRPRQQAGSLREELAHTGAAVIAPFGLAAAALVAGAALRATGHHRK